MTQELFTGGRIDDENVMLKLVDHQQALVAILANARYPSTAEVGDHLDIRCLCRSGGHGCGWATLGRDFRTVVPPSTGDSHAFGMQQKRDNRKCSKARNNEGGNGLPQSC